MIGVFDSGYGGLTILRALVNRLPQYSYTYFGDNAHAPYGQKKTVEITKYTKSGADFLFERGAQIVILGCNTASAAALRELQQKWLPKKYPDRRLLGIVVPTIEQVTGTGWNHTKPITTPISDELFTVGVLATPATVSTQAFPREVHKRNPSIKIIQQACPGLVELIERDAPKQELKQLVGHYIDTLWKAAEGRLDAILLGCTHYELISSLIVSLLPANVRLYHQPTIIAASLKQYLSRHPKIASSLSAVDPLSGRTSTRDFFTTGDEITVSAIAARYFGKIVQFKSVNIK